MTKYGVIYLATCQTSGKSYVGQTTQSVSVRWQQHRYGGCRVLAAAIRKYGPADFVLTEIDSASTQTELDTKEKFWIVELGTIVPSGYNLKEGGAKGKPSEETRHRLSESHKGLVLSSVTRERMCEAQAARRTQEALCGKGPVFTAASRDTMRRAKEGKALPESTKTKMSASRRGKSLSEEAKKKISEQAKDRVPSEESRQRMSVAHQGRRHSDETKARMSDARRGKSRSPEVMEKIAAANRGQRRSPEARARMREARKAFLQSRNTAEGGITNGS